ncbi:hypothetical protein [Okeania sp.]|uniref:hypothetical protein n=1 Tax=Okeania sp. TaxID=3100323 RepID=UPI002B4B3170|nr:hypothetical protein [Okeania sp.]
MKNKAGRWIFLSFILPTLMLHILGYVSDSEESKTQEAIDGLTIVCKAQENYYLERGKMYK